MSVAGIYTIKNKRTGEYYVGESRDIESRWKRHKYELNKGAHHSEKLQKAWNKYGEKAFAFRVVQKFWFTDGVNIDKLDIMLYLREEYYMDKYNSLNFGYNVDNTIGRLLRYYATGKGGRKYHRLKRYKYFCYRHKKMAQKYYHPLLIAFAYNKKILGLTLLILGGLYYVFQGV